MSELTNKLIFREKYSTFRLLKRVLLLPKLSCMKWISIRLESGRQKSPQSKLVPTNKCRRQSLVGLAIKENAILSSHALDANHRQDLPKAKSIQCLTPWIAHNRVALKYYCATNHCAAVCAEDNPQCDSARGDKHEAPAFNVVAIE